MQVVQERRVLEHLAAKDFLESRAGKAMAKQWQSTVILLIFFSQVDRWVSEIVSQLSEVGLHLYHLWMSQSHDFLFKGNHLYFLLLTRNSRRKQIQSFLCQSICHQTGAELTAEQFQLKNLDLTFSTQVLGWVRWGDSSSCHQEIHSWWALWWWCPESPAARKPQTVSQPALRHCSDFEPNGVPGVDEEMGGGYVSHDLFCGGRYAWSMEIHGVHFHFSSHFYDFHEFKIWFLGIFTWNNSWIFNGVFLRGLNWTP